MGLRAAIYSRVSTEDQAREGFSIAAQQKRLIAYCKARGWPIAGEFIDEGFSGRDINRPQYRRMMDRKDTWDVLVVLKMDRIHRNSRNFNLMMDDLKEWGKEFNSMQESFDTTTAIGRFVMDIIQRIAQLESEQIGERVKVGMLQKAKKGIGVMGGTEPYGYRFVDDDIEIVEDESEIVRVMFRSYLNLNSLEEIADGLNRKGKLTRKGGQWKKQTVSKILRNPIYCGYLNWDSILREKHHPEIVDLPLFINVQKMMISKMKNPSDVNNHFFVHGDG